MKNKLNKYFADELNTEEKADFLMEIENNEELKEEFIENQNLLALVDWVSSESEYENKNEFAQQKLCEFMHKMK